MDIYALDDYKELLKLWIRQKPRSGRGVQKNLAEHLGVQPALVSQVISGNRHFSEEQLFSVCEYLGFSELESQYILVLLQIERAGTVKLRSHYEKLRNQIKQQVKKVSARVPKSRDLSDAEKATFYSNYLYSAIQIATSLDQKVTFEFICKRFGLLPRTARKILDFLIQSDLVVEKDDRLTPGTNFTHLDKESPFLHKHLTNWRLKAIDAAAEATEEEVFYSVNFSINKADLEVLRNKILILIQESLKVIKDSPAEDIAQLNVDLFWVKK